MKKQIKLKNKSLPKFSFGGDLGKMWLDGMENNTLGLLGMDFYKPKFDSDTMGQVNNVMQGIGNAKNKLAPAALSMIPGVGTIAGAGLGAVQGIGNQVSNTQFKQYGGNMYQSGNEVNTNDMMPYNPEHLNDVSENLIKFDGPSHDRGGIKTPAGEFDKQETVLKKGVAGNPTPFAFSDNLILSKEVIKELGLPFNMSNKTIAQASKQIENKFETKYNDNQLQRSTKERMKQSLYTKLMNANKIEFAKNREMNGIQRKEDMSFDELNNQYQGGNEVTKTQRTDIITLPNGAEMTKEIAVKYAMENGLHKTLKDPNPEKLAEFGARLYSNRVAGEMRKTNGDFRHLGNDPENPEVTNRTDAQKLNPLIDLSNFNRPESKFLQTNDNPTVNPVNYDAISLQNYRKEQLADISKEDQVQQIQPQIQQESPTYKYNNIEYKKVDGQWMWKSNKTGALHPAKNFNDDFIERNNLEPGIEKGFKPRTSPNKKSIQNKTPYDKIEDNYDAFYNTDNTPVEPLDNLFYSKPATVTKKQESYSKPGLMDIIGNSFNKKAGDPDYKFSDYFSNLINTKATDRYDRNGKKYQGGLQVTNNLLSGYPQDMENFYKSYYDNYTPEERNTNWNTLKSSTKTNPFSNFKPEYEQWKKYESNSPVIQSEADAQYKFNYNKGLSWEGGKTQNNGITTDMSNNSLPWGQFNYPKQQTPPVSVNLQEYNSSVPGDSMTGDLSKSTLWGSMTDLEKVGLGANALSTLGQGLSMMKKDRVPTFYNENNSQVSNIMSDRRIDMQPIINDLNSQYNAATSKDNSRSWNVQRGLNTNMYNQYSKSLGELGMKAQEANNQYKGQYAEILNNIGQQNVQARTVQEDLQARTDANRNNSYRELLANTGKNLSEFAFTKNIADQTIKEGFKYLSMVSGDFKLNASDAREFATMLNSKDMSPIKAEMESGKFLGENGHELLLQRLQEINASPENTAKMLQLLTKTNKGK